MSAVTCELASGIATWLPISDRRQEVSERLLGGSTDIVIAGDSMMRQLFVRLIQMLRGRHRVFDYRVGARLMTPPWMIAQSTPMPPAQAGQHARI